MLSLLLALFVSFAGIVPAFAVLPEERLADPALEARAEAIGGELRCLVCRNESIEDSSADLAHDLRLLVRRRLVAGDSDRQVVQFLVSRYGDYVLLKPPLERRTWLLWFAPPALLVLGGAGLAFAWRRRRAAAGPAPLSEEERRRLERLLQEGAG